MDSEFDSMRTIGDALEKLSVEERVRVLRWASDKFLGPQNQQVLPALAKSDPLGFDDFASLMEQAKPDTDREKALVAGFWLQRSQNADWDTETANRELKEVGRPVSNIALAVHGLKPKYVMQTKSSTGTKKRKQYRLTAEGFKKIQSLISGKSSKESDEG